MCKVKIPKIRQIVTLFTRDVSKVDDEFYRRVFYTGECVHVGGNQRRQVHSNYVAVETKSE